MENDFWRRITRDEIITDYNAKAVNVDAYQRRDNKMTQQEKLKTKPDNRFISKALLCSILSVVEKASLVICNGQFSFSHRTSQVEPSPLLLDTFFKSSTLPWKNRQQTASWSFSWSFFPAKKNFKAVLRSIFVWRGTSRDFASRLAAKKLAPLANELVEHDSAVVSIGFSGAFLIVVGAHVALC